VSDYTLLKTQLLKILSDTEDRFGAYSPQWELDGLAILRQLVLSTRVEERQCLFREYYDSGPSEEVEKMKKSGFLDTALQLLDLFSIPNPETKKFYYHHLENKIKMAAARIEKFASSSE